MKKIYLFLCYVIIQISTIYYFKDSFNTIPEKDEWLRYILVFCCSVPPALMIYILLRQFLFIPLEKHFLRQKSLSNPEDYILSIKLFEKIEEQCSVTDSSGMTSIYNEFHFDNALTGSANKKLPSLALDEAYGPPLRVAERNLFATCLLPISTPYKGKNSYPFFKYIHQDDAQEFIERYQKHFILNKEVNLNLNLNPTLI